MNVEHDKRTCETCRLMREQELQVQQRRKINEQRIKEGQEPLDECLGAQVQCHCPICLGSLFDGDHWCSEKCYNEWRILKK